MCPDVPSVRPRIRAHDVCDVRDMCARVRMSRTSAHNRLLLCLGHWDIGTEQEIAVIDVKEMAGIAMNVRGQLADSIPDPQVTLGALAFANDLGRLLWRMKYGQVIRRDQVSRATALLAVRIRQDERFKRGKFSGLDRAQRRARDAGMPYTRDGDDIIAKFAGRLIREWTVDQCLVCTGTGKLGRRDVRVPHPIHCVVCSGTGRILADEYMIPFAAGLRGPLVYRDYDRCPACNGMRRVPSKATHELTQICPHCGGTAREPVDHAARALALGVSLEVYRKRWSAWFERMLAVLDQIDGAAGDVVRAQRR